MSETTALLAAMLGCGLGLFLLLSGLSAWWRRTQFNKWGRCTYRHPLASQYGDGSEDRCIRPAMHGGLCETTRRYGGLDRWYGINYNRDTGKYEPFYSKVFPPELKQ